MKDAAEPLQSVHTKDHLKELLRYEGDGAFTAKQTCTLWNYTNDGEEPIPFTIKEESVVKVLEEQTLIEINVYFKMYAS